MQFLSKTSVVNQILLIWLFSFFFFYSLAAQNNSFELNQGHQGWINGFAISTSNKYLVTISTDEQLIIWDYANGKQIRRIKDQLGLETVVISYDDRFLVTVDSVGLITKWDLSTGKKLFDFQAHGERINHTEEEVDITPYELGLDLKNQSFFDKNYIRPLLKTKHFPLNNNTCVTISKNNQLILSGGQDGHVKLWSAANGQLIKSFKGHTHPIHAVHLNEDSKRIISQDNDSQIIVWDATNGKQLDHFEAWEIQNIRSNFCYFKTDLDSLIKYNINTLKVIQRFHLPKKFQRCWLTSDENRLWISGYQDTTFLIDLLQRKIIDQFISLPRTSQINLDNKNRFIFTEESGRQVSVFEPSSKTILTRFGVLYPNIVQIKVSKNGHHLILNDGEERATLIPLTISKEPIIKHFNLKNPNIRHYLETSLDDHKLIAASADGHVYAHDMNDNAKVLHAKIGVFNALTGLDFNAENNTIVIAGYDTGLDFLNLNNLSSKLQYHTSEIKEYQRVVPFTYNLIQSGPNQSSLLINSNKHGYGVFFELNIKGITTENKESHKITPKYKLTDVNKRLTKFQLSKDSTRIICIDELNNASVHETKVGGKKLLSVPRCLLMTWLGTEEKIILYQSHQQLVIYDLVSQQDVTKYEIPYVPIALTTNADGRFLFLVTPDQKLEIRNSSNGQLLFTLSWQAGKNTYLLHTPQNSYQTNSSSSIFINNKGTQLPLDWKLFSTSNMFNALLWQNFTTALAQNAPISINNLANTDNPPVQKKLTLSLGHYHPIKHLSFQNKDEFILSVDAKGIAKTWDQAKGNELMSTFDDDLQNADRFENTANPLVLKYGVNHFRWLLHLLTGEIKEQPNEYNNANTPSSDNKTDQIVKSKNGLRFAKLLPDGTLEIRQSDTKVLVTSKKFTGLPTIIALDSLGKKAAVAIQNVIWIWDIGNNLPPKMLSNFYESKKDPYHAAVYQVLPSGYVVFSTKTIENQPATYKIIDLKKGTQKYAVFSAENNFTQQDPFRFNYDNKQIIDITSGQYYRFPSAIPGISRFFATKNREKFGIVNNIEKKFYLYDVQKGNILYKMELRYPVTRIQVDDSDSLVALIGKFNVHVIGLKSGKLKTIIPLNNESSAPVWVEFSTKLGILALNTAEQQITIWDALNNKLVRKIQLDQAFYRIFGISLLQQLVYTQSETEIRSFDFTGKLIHEKTFSHAIIAEYYPEQNKIIAATEPKSIHAINASSFKEEEILYFGKNDQWLKTDYNNTYQSSPEANSYVNGGTKSVMPKQGHQFIPVLLKTIESLEPVKATISESFPLPFDYLNLLWPKQLKKSNNSIATVNLPKIASVPVEVVIKAHFIPNSQNIALQDYQGDITIFENTSGRPLKTLDSPQDNLVRSVVTSNGEHIVSIESDNRIKLWSLKTLKLVKTFQLDYTTISALAINPECSILAVGTVNGIIHLYTLLTLEPLKEINTSSSQITHLALSSKGDYLAVGDSKSQVLLVNLKQEGFTSHFNLGVRINEYTNDLNGLAFHPNRPLLLCSGVINNYMIDCSKQQIEMITRSEKSSGLNFQRIWNENPKSPFDIFPHTPAFFNPQNPDEIYFLKNSLVNKTYYLFNYVHKQLKDSLKQVDIIYAIHPSGQQAIVDNGFRLLNLNSKVLDFREAKNQMVQTLEIIGNSIYYKMPSNSNIYEIKLDKPKTELIKGSYRQGEILDLAGKAHFVGEFSWPPVLGIKLIGQKDSIWGYIKQDNGAISKNGKHLAITKGSDSILIYAVLQNKVIHRISHPTYAIDLYLSNTGKHLALYDRAKGILKVIDFQNKSATFNEVSSQPASMYFSPDGKFFSFYANSRQILDLNSFNIVSNVTNTRSTYFHIASHQNPKYAILGSAKTGWANELWDIEKEEKIGDFYFWKHENEEATWVFIASDGTYEGSLKGLKQIFRVDEKNLRSIDVEPITDPKYQPGLLSKFITLK